MHTYNSTDSHAPLSTSRWLPLCTSGQLSQLSGTRSPSVSLPKQPPRRRSESRAAATPASGVTSTQTLCDARTEHEKFFESVVRVSPTVSKPELYRTSAQRGTGEEAEQRQWLPSLSFTTCSAVHPEVMHVCRGCAQDRIQWLGHDEVVCAVRM